MKRQWKAWGLIAMAAGLLLAAALPAQPPRRPRKAQPARQEEALPLQGRIIFVDAGHGGTDGGARARDSGVWEKEINLQVARALQSILEAEGARVIMSRETDREYSTKKRADLTARLDKAREGGAEMLISIHMNEYRSRAESGPQVFYRKGQEESRLLAGILQEKLIEGLQPVKERSALAGDYFMLSLEIPSVLAECGFLSNAAEEKLLLQPEYQERIARALCSGITEFFSLTAPQ